MGIESYRKSAADSLRSAPKSERPEKLAALQLTEEYWTARVDKLKESGQRAEFSENRTSLHWKTKNLYHGTDVAEIEEFKYAGESTIGNNAIYFTTDPALAVGYAKLRNRERNTSHTFLYEAVLRDATLMNWAEPATVEKLKKELITFCEEAHKKLAATDYKAFVSIYHLGPHTESEIASLALDRIIESCKKENYLHGGNIKIVAQGVGGVFFEKFVKDKGYDGVITFEGGDDEELTAKQGLSVVLYNKEKIISHRSIDVTKPLPPEL